MECQLEEWRANLTRRLEPWNANLKDSSVNLAALSFFLIDINSMLRLVILTRKAVQAAAQALTAGI